MTHLQLLRAAADCKQIDLLVEEYQKRSGGAAEEYRRAGAGGIVARCRWTSLGYAYTLSEDGKAELNVESPLLEKQVMVMPKK